MNAISRVERQRGIEEERVNLTPQREMVSKPPSRSSVKSAHGLRRSRKKSMRSLTSVEQGGAAGGFLSLAAPLSDQD